MRTLSWALAVGALILGAAPALTHAQDARAIARTHYDNGQALFNSGQYAAAEAEFQAAYQAVPNPVVLRAIASAQERQGNLSGALSTLEQYLRDNPAAADRAEVEGKIAEFRAAGASGDGGQFGNGGDGQGGGGEGGGPPEPGIGVWITVGIAAAALILGTVMGFLALSEQSNFDAQPTTEIADRGVAFALTADISFGVAGAAALTAIILYIIDVSAGAEGEAEVAPVAFELNPWANHQGGGLSTRLRF
jgi:tetratricopeptide (TPR) repeat protein